MTNTTQSQYNDRLTTTADRRKNERRQPEFEGVDVALFRSPQNSVNAELVDVSDGGIGVLVPCEDVDSYSIGFEVMVEMLGSRHMASIVHASAVSTGICRVGLQWQPPTSKTP